MVLWLIFLVLFGFGILFRYYTRETRCGWLTWVLPLGLYALGIRADLGDSAVVLLFFLVFGVGALCFGAGYRIHRACGIRS